MLDYVVRNAKYVPRISRIYSVSHVNRFPSFGCSSPSMRRRIIRPSLRDFKVGNSAGILLSDRGKIRHFSPSCEPQFSNWDAVTIISKIPSITLDDDDSRLALRTIRRYVVRWPSNSDSKGLSWTK